MKQIAILLLVGLAAAQADVHLPAIFSDHAVLQRSEKVPVWGRAEAGEEVSVSLGVTSSGTTADAEGKWRVALDLSKADAAPTELLVRGKNEIRIADVIVGEVWLCVGQSNMEMKLGATKDAKEVISQTNNPLLRHFKVERNAVPAPAGDVTGKWVVADPLGAREFSGVGFYFGRALQRDLKVPVGLIHSSWGGSLAEAWMSPEAFAGDEGLKQRNKEMLARADPAATPDESAETKGSQKALPPNKSPSYLFNGMLSPIIPYAIKGAIWYQGESNVGSGQADVYPRLLAALIVDWRKRWEIADLPLYICQLASFQAKPAGPGLTSLWAEFREGQTKLLETPQTGQAILIDIGEEGTVHPRNKKDVGERLARIALAKNYGQDVVFSGPVFQSAKVEGDKIRLKFAHAHGGLIAKPLTDTYQPKSIDPKTVPLVRHILNNLSVPH